MKKKIAIMCVIGAFIMLSATLCGCNWVKASRISFVTAPATTYTLNETDSLSFVISVTTGGKTETYSYADYKDRITVTNFSTASTGTRTAYVKFDNRLQLSFTYTVVDGGFAGGTGSETNPFAVATAAQFQNMIDMTTFNFYQITNDIDFTGFPLHSANRANNQPKGDYSEVWSGVIDGNDHTLLNLGSVLVPKVDQSKAYVLENGKKVYVQSNKYNELFGRAASSAAGKFSMKNLTIEFAGTGSSCIPGLIYSNGEGGEIEFTNVNLTGSIDCQYVGNSNVGPFISYVNRYSSGAKVTFRNCANDLNMINSYGVYYIGGYVSTQGNVAENAVTFDNCSFSGTIEGSKGEAGIGAFVTDLNGHAGAYVLSNCTIGDRAKIIRTIPGYDCGAVFNGKNNGETFNVTVNTDSLVDTISALQVNVQSEGENGGYILSVDPSASGITGVYAYKVFANGTMSYGEGNSDGGGFRLVEPVQADEVQNGILTKRLYTVEYDNVHDTPNTTDASCGSYLFVPDKAAGKITYYCKSVCYSVNMANTEIIVVAYDESGLALARGSAKTASGGEAINLNA